VIPDVLLLKSASPACWPAWILRTTRSWRTASPAWSGAGCSCCAEHLGHCQALRQPEPCTLHL